MQKAECETPNPGPARMPATARNRQPPVANRQSSFYRAFGKRLIDLCVTIPALLVVAPFLALVAVLVRLESSGPAFFMQERLGFGARLFRVYKFRTMTDKVRTSHDDINQEVIGKSDEITRVGYWLRRFKIDELPQLFNVLRGEMSLVGPRPGVPAHLPHHTAAGRRRFLVRPGLTGLAQISGNIHLSWMQRWAYDAVYVMRCSLLLDVWIVLRTFAVIAAGEEKFLKHHKPEGSRNDRHVSDHAETSGDPATLRDTKR